MVHPGPYGPARAGAAGAPGRRAQAQPRRRVRGADTSVTQLVLRL